MGLFKSRKNNTAATNVVEPKTPSEEEILEKKLREMPDDELMVFLSTLDDNQAAKALYSGDRYAQSSFFYRISNGNFKENLEKVPEEFAAKMICLYLDFYCTRYFEPISGNQLYVEEKVEIHSGELKEIWDCTKHEKVKQMLSTILCIYFPDVEEYLISTGRETIHREVLFGLKSWKPGMASDIK